MISSVKLSSESQTICALLVKPQQRKQAEIVMQNIEEQALATYSETLPLWLRYVDDTITAVHENKIDEFHEHLNRVWVYLAVRIFSGNRNTGMAPGKSVCSLPICPT